MLAPKPSHVRSDVTGDTTASAWTHRELDAFLIVRPDGPRMRALPVAVAIAVVGSAFLLAGANARSECRVRGQHVTLEDVVVAGRFSDPFRVAVKLAGIPAVFRIADTAGAPAEIQVAGAVAFRGRRKNVWYQLARPIELAGGLLRLAAGAQVVSARAQGRDVIASVVMWADDVLPGENKDPEEIIRDVPIPCEALTLGGADDDDDDDETSDESQTDGEPGDVKDAEADGDGDGEENDVDGAPPGHGDGTWWWTRGSRHTVRLRARPRADAPSVTLSTVVRGDNLLFFERVEERGGWLRVTRTGGLARITGWIRRADLERRDEVVPGRSTMCTGRHGPGLGGRGGPPRKIRYKGPARLRIGARITSWRGDPFATVRQDVPFDVVVFEGRSTAEVTRIPGLFFPDWFPMTVDIADVVLPE
jgi:hypothetical protein